MQVVPGCSLPTGFQSVRAGHNLLLFFPPGPDDQEPDQKGGCDEEEGQAKDDPFEIAGRFDLIRLIRLVGSAL